MAGNSTYKRRKAAGKCIDCVKRPPKRGNVRCAGCLRDVAADQKISRNNRIEAGSCVYCGKKPQVPGLNYGVCCAFKKISADDREILEGGLAPGIFADWLAAIESDGELDGLDAQEIQRQVDEVNDLYQRLVAKHPRHVKKLQL